MSTETLTTKRAYTRLDFSVEQEEQLIEYVKEHPALYNPKNSLYKNKTYRDRLLAEFGVQIDKTGEKIQLVFEF